MLFRVLVAVTCSGVRLAVDIMKVGVPRSADFSHHQGALHANVYLFATVSTQRGALSTPTVHTMDREKEGGKDSLLAKVGLLLFSS